MPLPKTVEARRFYRVAFQRLDDGQVLLRKGVERYAASIYLTGYAVECIMKAQILSASPVASHPLILREQFRGSRAHDLFWLREILAQKGPFAFPKAIRRDLVFLSTWSVDLRYTPGSGNENDARQFAEAADRVVRFFEQRCS